MLAIEKVRSTLPKRLRDWPELWLAWQQATDKERPDWMLPSVTGKALGGTDEIADSLRPLIAAVGCAQTSIILIDDLLDEAASTWPYPAGQMANLAAAFQAAAVELCDAYEKPIMNKLLLDTAVGQAMDARGVRNETEYWQLVRAKSAPFYAGALAISAPVMGAPALVPQLHDLGALVGEMVQIRDDLLDAMAVPISADWQRPFGNLVLLYGYESSYAEEFEPLAQAAATSDDALDAAQTMLIEIGAVAYCQQCIDLRYKKGLELIEGLEVKDRRPLTDLLDRQVFHLDG